MYKLNPYGDNKFSGTRGNPPTLKQLNLIKAIEDRTGIIFKGSTSKSAYAFIQEHYRDA
jgi:hypothetical protein